MKKVILECPSCHATKMQKLPKELMEKRNQSSKGVVTILIPEGAICPHLFLVYIDKNFSVRDTEAVINANQYNGKKVVEISEIDELIKQISPDKMSDLLKRL